MAHELEIQADGTASMFYFGETPWHGLGTQVHELLTAKDALVAGGLDWPVEKVPAYDMHPNGNVVAIPGMYNVRRATDLKVLGRVGGDYNPIQNAEAFAFFDTLVDSGEAKYETAGSLFGGKKVWLTARIGDFARICGEDYNIYLLISTTHDGSRAFTAATTFIRVVCNNTETFAMQAAKTKWSLHHKQTLEGKVDEARNALKLTAKATDAFQDEVERMIEIQVTKDQFNAIITAEGFLPEQKNQKQKNIDALMNVFENEPTIVDTDINGTGWGAFNAVTYWVDHVKPSRSLDARMQNLMDGPGFKLRNKTRQAVLALA